MKRGQRQVRLHNEISKVYGGSANPFRVRLSSNASISKQYHSDEIPWLPILATWEELERAWVDQDGRCALCDAPLLLRNPFRDRQYSAMADHDHVDGNFRGWLCQQCNSDLTWAEYQNPVFVVTVDEPGIHTSWRDDPPRRGNKARQREYVGAPKLVSWRV